MWQQIVSWYVLPAIVPLLAIGILVKLGLVVYKYVKSLYIQAEPNEFVVVIRNGEQKLAGVGLSTFRMPGDQVAIFPSRVNKVQFQTEQITKEMQGIQVKAMIVWSIYREGDGPMRAYKSLGTDLSSSVPRSANATLVTMSSAVVRNQIANSTIEEVIRNRQGLRDAIRKEMSEVVKGWGVWMETVEILDVKILSSSLFSNMQAKFREAQKKTAELQRMEVDSQIKIEQLKRQLEDDKRNADNTFKKEELQNAKLLASAELKLKNYKQRVVILKAEVQRRNQDELNKAKLRKVSDLAQLDRETQEEKNSVAIQVQRVLGTRQLEFGMDQKYMKDLKLKIELEEKKFEVERTLKQKQFDLEKEQLEDPVQNKILALQDLEKFYGQVDVQSIQLNKVGGGDALQSLMDKFTKIVE